jgi:hypothetical protein
MGSIVRGNCRYYVDIVIVNGVPDEAIYSNSKGEIKHQTKIDDTWTASYDDGVVEYQTKYDEYCVYLLVKNGKIIKNRTFIEQRVDENTYSHFKPHKTINYIYTNKKAECS